MKHKYRTKPQKLTVECLNCSEDIYIADKAKVGSFVTCNSCESLFEIIDLDPLMIDWYFYDDDYADEEDFFDDE